MRKKQALGLVLTAVLLLLSGCFSRTPDDLYQLPERSAGYQNLDRTIKAARSQLEGETGISSEYAVIFYGDNTSTIQLQDLDGDGERETAVTFLRFPGAEKAIKVCFFTQEGREDYSFTGMIEAAGSAVYAVDYIDLTGNGGKEIVISWQLSSGLYQLGAYSFDEQMAFRTLAAQENGPELTSPKNIGELLATELLLTSYSRYSLQDIDQDTCTELAVLRLGQAGSNSTAEIYGWHDGAFLSLDSVGLSAGVASLDGVRNGFVAGELPVPALYVSASLTDGGKATDILAYRDGALINLTLDPDTGVSREVVRSGVQLELTDIDGDTVLELPTSAPLPAAVEGGVTDFWLTEWRRYDVNGKRQTVSTTYHNRTDGWYLEIPTGWKGRLILSRSDRAVGQREVIFSRQSGIGKDPERFLAVYKLTGPNRSAWASTANRFILQEQDDTIYAATLLNASWDCGLDETALRERFHLIAN